MIQQAASKSVKVFSLLSPERSVTLHLGGLLFESAAVLSFVYNLTEARRPKPSVEPEKSIYKALRSWRDAQVPSFVVVVDSPDAPILGAPVVAWIDKKMSLQGEAPFGYPVVGTVTAWEDGEKFYEVAVDQIALAIAERKAEEREQRVAEKETARAQAEALEAARAAMPQLTEPEGYTGDKFTISPDGHFIGDDGFVVPKDFDEFYDRYPKYVLNWVKKRLNRFQVDDDVEDWTQDLLIHMKYLPQGSKHRLPGANGRQAGCADVIETFNPYQQYGASERRFRNYINFCLANKFNTVQSKRQKNPVCRPGNIPLGAAVATASDGRPDAPDDEYIHANSSHLVQSTERSKKQHDDRLFTGQFKDFVKKADPTVFPAIEALEATGPLAEAAAYMGVTEQEFSRMRTRLKQLGECFVSKAEVPKQRKPYKKRVTA